jgi:hypothetical protein
VSTTQREECEPADKPVRFYETALCIAAQLLLIVALTTHIRAAALAATVSAAVPIVVSL